MSDLAHPKVSLFTKEVARRHHLDPKFVDFVFAAERPKCFDYWCEHLHDDSWTCFVPDSFEIAYPLWSCNADQTLLLLREGAKSFGRGYHDFAGMEMISSTEQGLLADLMNSLWESEIEEPELKSAAEFCGFRYFEEYVTFIKDPELRRAIRDPDEKHVTWDDTWKLFIADIDQREMSNPPHPTA